MVVRATRLKSIKSKLKQRLRLREGKNRQMLKRSSVFAVLLMLLIASLISVPTKAAIVRRAASVADNGAASTASVTLNPPAGSTAGDVMVAFIGTRAATTITPPAGWISQTKATSGTTLNGEVFTKTYSSSDTTYTFSLSTTIRAAGIIVGYSGADSLDPIDVKASQANAANGGALNTPSITTTQPNTMLTAMYADIGVNTYNSAGSSGMTLINTTSSSGGGSGGSKITVGAQDKTFANPGATGTMVMGSTATTTVNIAALVAIREKPVVGQSSYRFFQNTDSTTASTPYAASGIPASIPASTPFRLRLNLGVSSTSNSMTSATGRNFRLQYAVRGSDNMCDTSFTNEIYTDVTTSTVVQFYNNPTPADGAAYVTNANDPTRSGITAVGQKYEESNPLIVGVNVPSNQDALWDIALTTNGASPGQAYCLRALDASDPTNVVVLNGGYSSMPEFSIPTPLFTQANYRWLTNADSATPGAPLAAQDATMTAPAQGVPFRLRSLMRVDGASIAPSYQNLILQYAQKSGTCDTGFSGETYANVNPVNNGSNYAGNSTNDSGTGSLAWSAYSDAWGPPNDGFWATVSDSTPGTFYSNWLRTNSYGFAVPANAVIKGIEVSVFADGQGGVGTYLDKINLARAGVVEPSGKSDSTPLTNNFDWHTYGGPSDLWGASWTPGDINNNGFGVAVSARIANGMGDYTAVDVDTAYIKVYYTVPGSALFQYYDNLSVASSTAISSTANDPADGARGVVPQTYNETDPFANTSTISAGQDGLWDFPIVNVSAPANTSYCFRMVKSDGSLLNTYTSIPELTTPSSASGPTLDQQLRGGQSVLNGVKQPASW